jgi:hypothetical protein
VKALALVFRFEVALEDRKMIVANRPGDAVRLRALVPDLDAQMAAGGLASYETLMRFCWAATRHHEDYTALGWEDFLDRCEAWSIVEDEDGGVRPTGGAVSSAP